MYRNTPKWSLRKLLTLILSTFALIATPSLASAAVVEEDKPVLGIEMSVYFDSNDTALVAVTTTTEGVPFEVINFEQGLTVHGDNTCSGVVHLTTGPPGVFTVESVASLHDNPGWSGGVVEGNPHLIYAFANEVACQPPSNPGPQPPFWSGDVSRIAGEDRYWTANKVAGVWATPGSTCVTIAQGRDDHDIDSITAGMLAAQGGMSTSSDAVECASTVNLLARDASLPSATRVMLEHLRPSTITVLGGELAVPAQVMEQLQDYTEAEVARIAGANRYETAAEIARASAARLDTSTVFVVKGQGNDLANALAAAGLRKHPVLLVRQDSVPGATTTALTEFSPENIVVVGNSDSVSEAVLQELSAIATAERIDGATHELVSVNLLRYLGYAGEVFVVRDDIFADGLAVSVLPGPVVTVRGSGDMVSDQFIQALNNLDTRMVTIVGGHLAVSPQLEAYLREASIRQWLEEIDRILVPELALEG